MPRRERPPRVASVGQDPNSAVPAAHLGSSSNFIAVLDVRIWRTLGYRSDQVRMRIATLLFAPLAWVLTRLARLPNDS
jgi:hypothetical protein